MPPSKNRLGRGLGNLIAGGGGNPTQTKKPESASLSPKTAGTATPSTPGSAPANVSPAGLAGFMEIAVASLEASRYQPRREFDPEALRELSESIRSEGLLQPVLVRAVGDKYQLIAGERRLRASIMAGLKMIPARVVDASDASAAVMGMIENLQRADLNPIEEALGYATLLSDFSLTQESVAERVGKGRATVANALRLLALDREVQGYLAKGLLSVGHAKVLLGLTDPGQQRLLARRTVEENWSVRDLEQQLRKLKAETTVRATTRAGAESTVIRDIEKRLAAKLNTRVTLKHTPKHGHITIEYFGNDDLQRLLNQFGVGG